VTPVKHNLVALGSAAVLAVYAAGYSRTRAAAAQFEIQSENRRPRTPPQALVAPVEVAPEPDRDTARDTTPAPATTTPSVPHRRDPARPVSSAKPAKQPDSTPSKAIVDTTASSVVAPPPVSTSDSSKTASVQATDSAATTTDKDHAAYKDGTYSGWGTSRHGDIEATVLIKGARIEAVIISQCLTQYSCSLISELPIQVVLRQSPEVDFVSGATQSTNAFYYAVIAALKKAK